MIESLPSSAPDRSPPHSAEAEEHVIACCLLDGKETIARCLEERLTVESFYFPANRLLFAIIVELHQKGTAVMIEVLAEELKTRRQLEAVGGFAYLMQVTGRIPTTAHAGYFIEKVREKHQLRELIKAATGAVEQAYDLNVSPNAIASRMLAAADAATGTCTNLMAWSPSQLFAHQIALDSILVGEALLERGEMTSLLGVGGLGKSRLAAWLALCWLTGREWCGLPTRGGPGKVLFVSPENGVRRWKVDLEKMLSDFSDVERETIEKHFRAGIMEGGINPSIHLGEPSSVAQLRGLLKRERPALLIMDPLADMVAGDENRAEDVIATLRQLRAILAECCPAAAVLLVHHARTGAANVLQAGDGFNAGNFGRGSKALFSAVRAELQLAPADRDDPTRLVLSCGKSNNGPKFAPRGLHFDTEKFTYEVDATFDLDSWRNDVAGKRSGTSFSIADAAEIVREMAPHAGTEAAAGAIQNAAKERFGAGSKTVQRRLSDACREGYLRSGKKGFYRLGAKPLPK